MGKKKKKTDILAEIIKKIEVCEEYQKQDPDPSAETRIKTLEEDLCNDSVYYVNITLKDVLPEENTSLSERKRHMSFKKILPVIDNMESFFCTGCIIIVDITEDGVPHFTVSAAGSFSEIVNTVKSFYFNDKCYVAELRPRKSIMSDVYIEDDLNAAMANNKNMIVYAMARFNKSAIEEWLKDHYTEEMFDLDKWEFNYFKDVAYVDMTKITSLEQNVHEYFENPGVLHSVTMFSAKSKLPDYNLPRQFGVYDMVYYVVSTLEEIRKTDAAQGRRKYAIYSQGVFKDYLEGKYDTYLNNGGDGSWANWNDCQGQFLTFKALAPTDPELKEMGMKGSYNTNLFAYEQTAALYSNTPPECISDFWIRETDKFKKQPPGAIVFTNNPRAVAQGKATEIIMSKMVDPPVMRVNPYGGTNIKFDEAPTYSFSIAVEAPEPNENEAPAEVAMVSKPSSFFERVDGNFQSTNRIDMQRDLIKLDGVEYLYTDVDIELSRNDALPYLNDITAESGIFTIPAKSYYSNAQRTLFMADNLDARIIQSTLSYQLIPKKVTIPVKFIQESYWANRDPADQQEKRVRNEYESKALRICVDAIPYDPWEKMIERLNKLYGKWNRLPPDADGYFEFPPIEEFNAEELEQIKCDRCGKNMKECECDKCKLCTKYFPIDMFGMGEYVLEDMGMFNASTTIHNIRGEKMTLSMIARAFYTAMFPKEETKEEDFMSMSKYAKAVLNFTWPQLCVTQAYSIDGSPISQFDLFNFMGFLRDYEAGLKQGAYFVASTEFSKKMQIGLMDGMLYVPTGYDIAFQFNPGSYSLTVDGVSVEVVKYLSKALTDAPDQEKALANFLEQFPEGSMGTNMKKFIVFPGFPDVDRLLTNSVGNIREYVDEYDEDVVFKPKFTNLKSMIGKDILTLRFDIYIKKPVLCSNPRCLDIEVETNADDGVCGLDEFFRTPMIIASSEFQFFTELKKKMARVKMIKLRRKLKTYEETGEHVKTAACDVKRNLEVVDDVKRQALAKLYKFGTKYQQLISTLPRDPISNTGLSVVCNAAKNSKQRSVIEDFNDVFMHTINMMFALKDDEFNYTEVQFNGLLADLSTCSKMVIDYYNEVKTKAPNFNMCQVKNEKYLDEDKDFRNLKDGMIERECAKLAKGFEIAVVERLMNHGIFRKASELGLIAPEEVERATRMIAGGDILGVKSFIEEHETELKKAETEPAEKMLAVKEDLSALSEMTELNSDEKGLAKGLGNIAKKELDPTKIASKSLISEQNKEKIDKLIKEIKKKVEAAKALDTSEKNTNDTNYSASKVGSLLKSNDSTEKSLDDISSVSEQMAILEQQPGEMQEQIDAAVTGSEIDSIDKQGTSKVKQLMKSAEKNAKSNKEAKSNVADNVLNSMMIFLAESSADYKTLTDEVISFD